MMHQNATNAARPPSLVDTLGAGFSALNRSLLALVVPVLVDLWIWLGPRVSLQPLAERLRSIDPATWDSLRQQLEPALPTGGLDLRLYGQFPFWRRIYMLVPGAEASPPIVPATWYIGGFLALFGAVIVLNLLLTLLTALFLLPMADVVRGEQEPRPTLRRILRAWWGLTALVGMVMIFLVVVGIPISAIAGILSAFFPAVGVLFMSLFMGALLWLVFTASFAVDAVVMDDVGPLRALMASLGVIRSAFWGAIGLFLLNVFILRGLEIVWERLTPSVPGLIIAILSSAYIGAGLAAAHLVFYRSRKPSSPAANI